VPVRVRLVHFCTPVRTCPAGPGDADVEALFVAPARPNTLASL
jgi:hypothetical protein